MEIICSICCCSFVDQFQQETTLPFSRKSTGSCNISVYCGHVFHKSCITKWIEKSGNCPECRAEITSTSDFHRVYFNVNPKCELLEQSDADQEKLVMQKRTEKLTKYIKCVTKELGHVELKFDKLKTEIAKKDQEIAELRNLLNVERLVVPLRRQTLK
jgi:RING-H2 zinc finger domain